MPQPLRRWRLQSRSPARHFLSAAAIVVVAFVTLVVIVDSAPFVAAVPEDELFLDVWSDRSSLCTICCIFRKREAGIRSGRACVARAKSSI